ncbi:MAG: hypothetical protein JSS79_11770 [Bacteroidetes bacterium]|nr:hypothetical protein [Bacteroidota bacterium]
MNTFEEHHIDRVWKFLHERFGFNINRWKERFDQFRTERHKRRTGHDYTLTGDFIYFGNTVINPVLNEILGHYQETNTFNRMIEYIVTGKRQR